MKQHYWNKLALGAWRLAHWADERARHAAIADVTNQVRRPKAWALRHPVVTVRRKMDRRKSG